MAKTLTSNTLGSAGQTGTTEFGRNEPFTGAGHAADNTAAPLPADQQPGNGNEEKVMVKPLRTFRGEEGLKGPNDEAFEVRKSRAAELFANGLVDYQSDGDHSAMVEERVKQQSEVTRRALAGGRMRDDQKSSPLEQKLPDFKKE